MSPYLWLLILIPVQIASMPNSDVRLHHIRHHNHTHLHHKRHSIAQNLVFAEDEYVEDEYVEDEFEKRYDAACGYTVEKVSDAETSCVKRHLQHIKCSNNKTYEDGRCIQTYRNIVLDCDDSPTGIIKLFTGCVFAFQKSSTDLGRQLNVSQ